VIHKLVEGGDDISTGIVGSNMIGVGNTNIGRCLSSYVLENVLVDLVVVGIELQGDVDIGIKLLKVLNCITVNLLLSSVVFVFSSEGYIYLGIRIKILHNVKFRECNKTVASGQ
jgi:hypothetical protein